MAYTTINKSTDNFRTKLWTGNGVDDRNITFDETTNMQPDFTWIKSRSGTNWNTLFDAVRGAGNRIYSNAADPEDNNTDSLQAFQTNGFQVGTNSSVNGNTNQLVAWNWKANGSSASNSHGTIASTVSVNTAAGFSIVAYTGNGTTGATVGHGLGVKPNLIILKFRNAGAGTSTNWQVYHSSLGAGKYVQLNSNGAATTSNTRWNGVEPTNQVFTLGSSGDVKTNYGNFIAYCFAEKTGYSKFGSYTGNGNSDGAFIYTGFKPAFLMIKQTDTTGNWALSDNKRNNNGNGNFVSHTLAANLNNNESHFGGGAGNKQDFLSNGFKIRDTGGYANTSGGTYIYAAFGQSLVGSNNVPCTAR